MRLEPVTASNWRDVVAVDAASEHVAAPAYYLCLCHYGQVWQPLALLEQDVVVGFAMWGLDTEDGHHWLGGLSVDRAQQGRGLGRSAVLALVEDGEADGETVARLAL